MTLSSLLRVSWTIATLLVVETLVCALSAAPAIACAVWVIDLADSHRIWLVSALALGAGPAYAMFALSLLILTPIAVRVTGWRTPDSAEMSLKELGWPVLRWARYVAVLHVARFFAGGLLRGTPLWTIHLRWCGARLGRRVYVNSLSVSDYNLLDFGDDVVIGADAHVSGHTVEAGFVKTGKVTLGAGVTIGLNAIVEIDAEIASGCQVGAMTFVPKHARLIEPGTYVGVPASRLPSHTG